MASISTTLELVDHMSGRLAAIGSRVQALTDRFSELDGRIGSVQASMERLKMGAAEMSIPEIPALKTGYTQFGKARMAGWELPELRELEVPISAPETLTADLPQAAVIRLEYLLSDMPELPAYVTQMAQITYSGLSKTPEEAFYSMESGMLTGLAEELRLQRDELAAAAAEGAGSAVEAVRQLMDGLAGKQIGMDFSIGLARGIRGGMGSVVDAARAVAAAAAAASRAALDIHSPSRVSEGIGLQFAAGFAGGIADKENAVSRAAGRLCGIACRELDTDIWKGLHFFSELERIQTEDGGELFVSEADARRMRELAEKEVLQRFTTAELNVEFTANNTIDSKMDLDSVVSYLEEQVAEKLALAAEGVYI